jgi:predicted nucleotidyltransferase
MVLINHEGGFMLTDKQLVLFGIFARQPLQMHTRGEIMTNSNNMRNALVMRLKQEGVLTEQSVGRTGLLALNMESDSTHHYIAMANLNALPAEARRALTNIRDQVSKVTPFHAIVVFGSFAAGKQTRASDLDVAIIVEKDRTAVEAACHEAQLKTVLQLDFQVIGRKELKEMLAAPPNVGTEIARSHLAIYNPRIFYDIIMEAYGSARQALPGTRQQ